LLLCTGDIKTTMISERFGPEDVHDCNIAMERPNDQVQSAPEEMELEFGPGTVVIGKGEQKNRQRTTSVASAYSVDTARSSQYDEDIAAVRTAIRGTVVPMAACEPSLMTDRCESPPLLALQGGVSISEFERFSSLVHVLIATSSSSSSVRLEQVEMKVIVD